MASTDVKSYLPIQAPRFTVVLIAAIAVLFTGVLWGFHAAAPKGAVPKGVRVAGINVGGMSEAEARHLLDERLRLQINRPIQIIWDGGDQFIYPADSDIAADIDNMVKRAMQIGREGNIIRQMRDRYWVQTRGYDIPLRVQGGKELDRRIRQLQAKIDRPPVNAKLQLEPDDTVKVVPEQSGLVVNTEKLRHNILVAATLTDRVVHVPVEVKEPDITASELRSWGIRTVITRFETTFKTGDVNRTHNLRIATAALDGAVIAPGATFSFNKHVGPRVPGKGYKEAPVVINGELDNGIGGGVCQVSTTLYNATLLAGLRIDSRSPHSIPSSYVPLGRDATVAYDYIDFRFTNTTQHYIYIQAGLVGNKVRVTLLGADKAPPARLVSKIDAVKPFPTKEITDPSLPKGKRVVESEGGNGYSVSVWKVSGSANAEKWQLLSRSTYKPRARVLRIGTGSASAQISTAANTQNG